MTFYARKPDEPIVFRVVRGRARRRVTVPAANANKRSSVLPLFTMAEMHGLTVRLK